MKTKILFTRLALCLVAVFALAFLVAVGGTEAKTITVDDDGGADYEKIQDAINAAEDGDTIRVYAGSYEETLTINKPLSVIGNGSGSTSIAVDDAESDAVRITAPYCTFSGFYVRDLGGNSAYSALHVLEANFCTIANIHVTRHKYGIYLSSSSQNHVVDSNIEAFHRGLFLDTSNDNVLDNNDCRGGTSADEAAVYLLNSDNNRISNSRVCFIMKH